MGPRWCEPRPDGMRPPQASLFDAAYPVPSGGQVVNRWPRHASLTSKDGSLRALVTYYEAQELNPWTFVPLSFTVPNFRLVQPQRPSSPVADSTRPSANPAFRCFMTAHALGEAGRDPRVPAEQSQHNLWLLKPTNSSGGRGIEISSDAAVLERALLSGGASTQAFLMQKYLEAPLLFSGRKFDLRVWVAVTSDPGTSLGLRIHVYREGYGRTSSEPFALPDATRSSTPTSGSDEKLAREQERLVHVSVARPVSNSDGLGLRPPPPVALGLVHSPCAP